MAGRKKCFFLFSIYLSAVVCQRVVFLWMSASVKLLFPGSSSFKISFHPVCRVMPSIIYQVSHKGLLSIMSSAFAVLIPLKLFTASVLPLPFSLFFLLSFFKGFFTLYPVARSQSYPKNTVRSSSLHHAVSESNVIFSSSSVPHSYAFECLKMCRIVLSATVPVRSTSHNKHYLWLALVPNF